MAVRSTTHVRASPHDCYLAVRQLLGKHVEDGAFKVREDEPGRAWGMAWEGPLATSRYLFRFEPEGDGTVVDAELWLGGLLGPVHSVLRRRGNRVHIESILSDLQSRAEADGDDDDWDEDEWEDRDDDDDDWDDDDDALDDLDDADDERESRR